jgi:hypothetical protein
MKFWNKFQNSFTKDGLACAAHTEKARARYAIADRTPLLGFAQIVVSSVFNALASTERCISQVKQTKSPLAGERAGFFVNE